MAMASIVNTGEHVMRRRAPRLAGDARRAQIVEAAGQFFSQNGFSGPTRDLAASIGVTQALLYRYFDSKTDLIDAVFGSVFKEHWSEGGLEVFLNASGASMVDRLCATYEFMLPRVTGTAIRLLYRAGLDSYARPIHCSAEKSWPLWSAMLDGWRAAEALPTLEKAPMLEGERALVLSAHNSMMMIRVREHVFLMPRPLSDTDEIRQVAEAQDAGVRAVMRRLHQGQASDSRVARAESLEAA